MAFVHSAAILFDDEKNKTEITEAAPIPVPLKHLNDDILSPTRGPALQIQRCRDGQCPRDQRKCRENGEERHRSRGSRS
jgi:hypothetical protein